MDLLNNEPVPRRTMVLFFLVDCSGSMYGSKIGAVNDAIRNVLPMVQEISDNNPDAEIKVAVLKFSTGCEWVYSTPKSAADFEWVDIDADGVTDLGDACKELSRKLSRSEFLQSKGGYYGPAVILLSDGGPTDDFNSGLTVLKKNQWFKHTIKVAIAIGSDADTDVLSEFTGNKELVFEVNRVEALKKIIRLAVVTSSMVGSHSSEADDKTKEQKVADEMKKELEDDKTGIKSVADESDSDGSTDDYSDWD